MPILPYHCHGCGHEWSADVALDPAKRKSPRCPKCGGRNTQHIFDATPAQFKGEGWTKQPKEPDDATD